MASKNNLIKPPVVLAVVCACCCGLLAVANSVTKDKIAAAEAASIQASLQQLPNAGNFTEVSDFQPANNEKATATAVYVDENQQTAVLVTANGYNRDHLCICHRNTGTWNKSPEQSGIADRPSGRAVRCSRCRTGGRHHRCNILFQRHESRCHLCHGYLRTE